MLLHVHTWGPEGGAPVVCLHGVAGHGRRFARLAEDVLANRRVVAFDLRGHGRSDPEAPWSVETFRDDVLETADSLGIGRADWVGHSFGGRLIAEVASAAPERVARAVLLDPALRLPGQLAYVLAEDERRKPEVFASREEAFAWRKSRTTVADDDLIRGELEEHLEAVEDGVRFRYVSSVAIAVYGELARPTPDPSGFPGPVLLFRASMNSPVTAEEAARYRGALGDRLVEVTLPVGHNLLWEAFPEVGRVVGDFLGPALPAPA